MKKVFLIAVISILFLGIGSAFAYYHLARRSCTPIAKGKCTACKNCSGCKHCHQNGGKCSVCK